MLGLWSGNYFLWLGPVDRLLGWWSIDEGSSEERARLYCAGGPGYVFYAKKFNAFLLDFLVSFPLSRGIIFSEGSKDMYFQYCLHLPFTSMSRDEFIKTPFNIFRVASYTQIHFVSLKHSWTCTHISRYWKIWFWNMQKEWGEISFAIVLLWTAQPWGLQKHLMHTFSCCWRVKCQRNW